MPNSNILDWVLSDIRLSDEICDAIVELGLSLPAAEAGVIGDDEKEFRQAMVRKIRRSEESATLVDFLGSIIMQINQDQYQFDLQGLRDPEFVEYRANFGHFHWHHDHAIVTEKCVRKLTMVVQLSAPHEYEGGELQVAGSPPIGLPRERGMVVVFPAFLHHRVTGVSNGVRRSLVVWAYGPRFR